MSAGKWQVMAALVLSIWTMGFGATARAAEATADETLDQQEEIRSNLGALTQQVNDLKKWSDELPKLELNVDLRYDAQRFKSATVNPLSSGPKASAFVDGGYGMYAKRTEVKVKGAVPSMSWMSWVLQYDFSGMLIKDVGIEMTGLNFLPWMETPGWTLDMKVGQFRQPFGIEPQTSSSSAYFSERSMLNGGANPFGFTALVKERVMGLHFKHKKDLGAFAYNAAFAVGNDFDNSTKGGTGTDSLAGSFPNQVKDQDPSEFGRLGLESLPLNAALPLGTKLAVGASALHNSENTVLMASSDATQAWSDVYGFDASLEISAVKLQAEWAAKNQFKAAPVQVSLFNRAEAWYALADVEPLKFFYADAPRIEVLARYESVMAAVDKSLAYPSDQAVSVGLRYQFMGKNYTSVNYSTYAVGGDFLALPGTELFIIQQQFNY